MSNAAEDRYVSEYVQPFGTWHVITEGDVEGRTIKDLGIFGGYVDEIALHLAKDAYYTLTFERVAPVDRKLKPTRAEVHVGFDIGSKTWDLKEHLFVKIMKEAFRGRPVLVGGSQFYKSFMLTAINAQTVKETIALNAALDKLTPDELALILKHKET
jgi:hypothetical protein